MFFKTEYENLLALLKRAEIRGLEEAKAVAILGLKIEKKIAEWIHGPHAEPDTNNPPSPQIPLPLEPPKPDVPPST